ncbi:hypothetical protein K458DRAFT_429608 [Lentithecium fluviatile CBS 122367]|uniref:Uncharacterized protein n=1 Tax=Lentithecium fluviatile CBS 122367 TaxID=1168545 RepID=A0A6G1J8T5_9PLEO|nr:hypothetical protein K458DRAFT_429608 [Lentithecium fluviatile CBS 122367]
MKKTGYIDVEPTLVGCDRRVANDYVESLGLRDYSSPGAPRPEFKAEVVKGLYNSTQAIVDSTANAFSSREVREGFKALGFLQPEATQLLDIHGSSVWGNTRDHLLDAIHNATTLYPKNLFAGREPDRTRIIYLLRCWIARRAYRKAGLAATARARQESSYDAGMRDERPDTEAPESTETENALIDASASPLPLHDANFPTLTNTTRLDRRVPQVIELGETDSQLEQSDETDSVISSRTESDPLRSTNRKRPIEEPPERPLKRACQFPHRQRKVNRTTTAAQASSTVEPGRAPVPPCNESNQTTMAAGQTSLVDANTQEARTANMRIQSQSPDGPQTRPNELPVLSLARTQILRRKILNKLLQVLRSGAPSMEVLGGLDTMINDIWTAEIKDQMTAGGRLSDLKEAFFLWIEMHTQFLAFRTATGYTGGVGEAWTQYVDSLTEYRSASLAMEAFNMLGTWRWEMVDTDKWVQEPLFTQDLAQFFARLVDMPGCSVGFIARGLSMYNEQLLEWFGGEVK